MSLDDVDQYRFGKPKDRVDSTRAIQHLELGECGNLSLNSCCYSCATLVQFVDGLVCK